MELVPMSLQPLEEHWQGGRANLIPTDGVGQRASPTI